MSQWIKIFVFSTSHGHTGASEAKGDKDDYGIGECAMQGEVERAGIVQSEEKVQAGYISYTSCIKIYIYVSIYKNT